MESLSPLLRELPGNLANHLLISVLSLMLGLALSIPLAILAVRSPKMRYPTLTAVSIVQTIPSLALLALMVPILVGIGAVTSRLLGVEFSALGFYPTIIALTLYSMLPIVRNTVAGILGIDPALTEAARGLGMSPWQSLRKVEFPLALPVIIAGIRTATVWTVGIATLATPVGQRCLGNYIFAGLQTRNWTAVLFGCVAAATLAIVLDSLIGGIQKAIEERRRGLGWVAGGALVVVIAIGLIAPWAVRQWQRPSAPAIARDDARREEAAARTPLVIGSKTFTEQYILQTLLAETLQDAGFQTEQKESLGSTVIFNGLINNEIDCYVEYTGTIWANYMKRKGSAADWQVLAEVRGWLAREHNVRCLGPLGFENAYVLAMRRPVAERLRIETINDLTEHAPEMKIGSAYEFFSRPEWPALQSAYGLRFSDRVNYNSTFMYDALENGDVDVIAAFSSDGRIESLDLVLLDDPQNAIPPYDAVILLSPRASKRPRVAEVLQLLIGRIDVELMRQANYLVDRDMDKKTVHQAAGYLQQEVRGKDGSKKGAAEK